ncbi:PhoX family phosphatase [Aestuariivirga sp.]|uniref:PhoX family protein n=1 Tax=Aestuariivirga sp. TaxID=2650926 RepID=UPI0035936D41
MSSYEHDYSHHTLSPDYAHGDERPSNTSANPTFYDVMDARASRRGFILGSLAALASGLYGVPAVTSKAALASSTAASGLLGFKAVPVSKEDAVVVPEGYKVQVLAPWGTPINGATPEYKPGMVTGADQAQQVGSHHDGMHFFPIDGSSEDGLLVMNHEYVEPRFVHAAKWKGQKIDNETVVFDASGMRDADEVLAEINGHGCSVIRIKKGADGQWGIVADPMNRRITGLTLMDIAGPARGSAHLVTKYSPDGTRTRGTLNNCAHGVTPWNTYMSAEENWAGYFVNTDKLDQKSNLPREQARYGVPAEKSRYGWEKAVGGSDEVLRFDASARGAAATEDYRNEPNTFGWMIEFNPYDPASVPVKRTALGRFAHEGIVFAPAAAGKPIVCYSGDDARFEYIYKFVSARPYDPASADGSLLDDGTLHVAKFNADGSGEWLALAPGQNGLTPENGFADLADILVNTRLAADKAGATKMDRPEWGAVDPNTGEVYFTLTNNNRRAQTQVDAVNPRAENNFGQIVRWRYANGDHAATTFQWELFVLAGTKTSSALFTGKALDENSIFACPDGMWCDANSRLWIQTDMGDIGPEQKGTLAPFGMNQMLAADPKTGEVRRFLTGPWGQEITGVVTTPDQKTMFVNVQHPGGHATDEQFAAGDFGSGFPDYKGTVPRSATLVITRDDGGIIGA